MGFTTNQEAYVKFFQIRKENFVKVDKKKMKRKHTVFKGQD